MPPWALGKDVREGASPVDGKMEAPLGAAHGDEAGVQQELLRLQSWEHWAEARGQRGGGSPWKAGRDVSPTGGGAGRGIQVWEEAELQDQAQRQLEAGPGPGRLGRQA